MWGSTSSWNGSASCSLAYWLALHCRGGGVPAREGVCHWFSEGFAEIVGVQSQAAGLCHNQVVVHPFSNGNGLWSLSPCIHCIPECESALCICAQSMGTSGGVNIPSRHGNRQTVLCRTHRSILLFLCNSACGNSALWSHTTLLR